MADKQELHDALQREREEKADVYYERNMLVALLASMAIRAGEKAGLAYDADPDCPKGWRTVVFFEINNKQISFHVPDKDSWMVGNLPLYSGEWDFHDTEEKYKRMEELL